MATNPLEDNSRWTLMGDQAPGQRGAYMEHIREQARALAEQTAIPEQVITDRLSEDGYWFL